MTYLPDDLVGMTEAAHRYGTSTGALRVWRSRYPDFPQPVARLAMGPVWRWGDMERWLTTRKRLDKSSRQRTTDAP